MSVGGVIVIPAGDTTGTITVPLLADQVYEGDEQLDIELVLPAFADAAITTHSATLLDDQSMPEIFFFGGPWSVVEGTSSVSVEVQLSGLSDDDVSVQIAPLGSAAPGSDYTIPGNQLTIPAGSLSVTMPVTILDDADFEDTEELIFVLASPTGALLGVTATSSLFIADDDAPPTINFAVEQHAIGESTPSYDLDLTITPPATMPITVGFVISGSATVGTDVTFSSTTLTIPAGSSFASITLLPIDDTLDETDETIVVTIVDPIFSVVGSAATTTVVLVDDDTSPTVTFANATSTASEGSGTVTVDLLLSAPSAHDIQLPFSLGGTAQIGPDVALPQSPALVPAGSTTATISVTLVDNTVFENPETVEITLDPPIAAILGAITTHTITILDDEAVPTVEFLTSNATVLESSGSGSVLVTLSSSTVETVVVPFTVTGTAAVPGDLSIGASPIVFAPGTAVMALPISMVDDTLDEALEVLTITLGTPTGATLGGNSATTLSIPDNDDPPEIAFDSGTSTWDEGAGIATLAVNLSEISGREVVIPLTFTGPATTGSDFAAPPTTLLIPPGVSEASLSVALIDDNEFEPTETLTVTLSPSTSGSIGSPGSHTLTILDDDVAPALSFATASSVVDESAGTATVELILDIPNTVPVEVSLTTTGGASPGFDYLLAETQTTIPAGDTQKTLVINVLDDTFDETDETIELSFGIVTGATPTGTTTHTVTIVDEDPLPVVAFTTASASEVIEDIGSWTTEAVLDTASGLTVTVPLLLGGTATAAADFTVTGQTVTFPPESPRRP